MESGDKGPAVEKVQQALLDLGFPMPKFGADGDFGSETRDAVKAFQRAQRRDVPGFDVDGRVGFGTIDRLDLAIFRLRLRKNVLDLTFPEREAVVAAMDKLRRAGGFKVFVSDHAASMPRAHRQSAFLPWHRQFILNFESKLREHDDTVSLPYWDWAADPGFDSRGNPMWNATVRAMMGGNGEGANNELRTGPFKHWRFIDEKGKQQSRRLQRSFGIRRAQRPGERDRASVLPTEAEVTGALTVTPYDQAPWNADPQTGGFRNLLEGWAQWHGARGVVLHNAVHVWVGGDMARVATAPNDPVFYLHHCMVDKIWADWQGLHPKERYLPRTRQGRAFGGSDPFLSMDVRGDSPKTITPDETWDLADQKDNLGAKNLNVRYV